MTKCTISVVKGRIGRKSGGKGEEREMHFENDGDVDGSSAANEVSGGMVWCPDVGDGSK